MVHPLVEEWDVDLRSGDPLAFPGYADELATHDGAGVRTGRTDGYVLIEGDFGALGGSMGAVHGEKVVRAWDRATALGLPVVVVTCSGGARMQEGMVSLIQMARTAAAAGRHGAAGLLSVAVHRSPTTGGVLASYGSLCDLRAAEAGATIGFAGPRVAQAVTGHPVSGSHKAATALAAGLVDAVVDGDTEVAWVEGALGVRDVPLVARPLPVRVVPAPSPGGDGAWAEVQRARQIGRPSGVDVAADLVSSWTELGGVDPTLRVGVATVAGRRAVVLASDRYAGTGRPTPAAFRLAQRGIALAGRLGWPVVSLVDTPGAEPGSHAENDGIAAEIARTFAAMAELPTPSVAVCVGEGGSGGALALAAADRLLIQEHAIFSVIGPEGAAAILERDVAGAPRVAARLKLTSTDVHELGIVDGIVPDDVPATVAAIVKALEEAQPGDRLRRADAATARWIVA
ncbi:MAG: hypothetical protein JWN46_1913 [Acidimicrobiales bacterium]|nr:hypothetical protein [Acidimicrobiales bacterium]